MSWGSHSTNPLMNEWGEIHETQAIDCGGHAGRRLQRGSAGRGCRFGQRRSRRPGRPWRSGTWRCPRADGAKRSRRPRWPRPGWTGWSGWSRWPRRTRSWRTRWTSRRARRSRTWRPGWAGRTWRPRRAGWPGRTRRSLARRSAPRLLQQRTVGQRTCPLGTGRTAPAGVGSTASAAGGPVELRPDQLLGLPGDPRVGSWFQPVGLLVLRSLDPAVTADHSPTATPVSPLGEAGVVRGTQVSPGAAVRNVLHCSRENCG